MTVLYLIVARGGSKRLPGKNLKEILDISLVGYKCLAATKAKSCSLAMISTDSPQIAEVARQYGVLVPFIRPAELATDEATTEDVVRHAMAWCEEHHQKCDAIQLLEPSSPFIAPYHYDVAVEVMRKTGKALVLASTLYLFRWDYLTTRRDLYDDPQDAYPLTSIPEESLIDIDTLRDFHFAECLAEKGYVDLSWAKT